MINREINRKKIEKTNYNLFREKIIITKNYPRHHNINNRTKYFRFDAFRNY